jgi:hypothetical protein
MLVSDCCGASTCIPEYGICPECYEHCDFINEEEDEEYGCQD